MTAQKGRTYDRTAPSGETSEKALVSGAVPHMTIRGPFYCFRAAYGAENTALEVAECSQLGAIWSANLHFHWFE